MKPDQLILGIPAYTTFRGGGLMHFLFQAIPALSRARPSWIFEIVGSIALPELQRLVSDHVILHYWDGDARTRVIDRLGSQALKWLGKGSDAGFLLQKRSEMAGLPWGRAAKRVAALRSAHVIWVPHYNLSLSRISLFDDLDQVRAPVLFTIHDIHPAFYPEEYPAGDLARFHQGFIPLARSCACIFTHSKFQKSAIARHLNLPADKIKVIPQPPLIDPVSLMSAYHPNQTVEILARYGIQRSYAFYPASTTHSHKNHVRLFSAWVQLKKLLGAGCPLLVCTGKGSRRQYQRLSSLVADLGLQDDVLFTGPIDTTTLATLYQNCALVVIPTLYEGAGSGILTDALVTGKPVACSNIQQVQEQLAALGPVAITTFDATDVTAIANAVQSILSDLNGQQQTALQNQVLAQNAYHEMWRVWAEAYAQCIEGLAAAGPQDLRLT